jgi:hypothetical protein
MPMNAQTLAAALHERGYRAEAFPPDPPHSRVDVVNVWHDRHDRYPATTVWEPFEGDGWQWGDSYQYDAPADIPAGELADRVIATLAPR